MPTERSLHVVAAVLLIPAMACLAQARADGEVRTLPGGDILPPEIIHTPLEEFPAGMPLRIQARVTDDTGVKDVILFYRNAGEAEYRQLRMLSAAGSNLYAATLPDGAGPRVEYFIRASDVAGNSVLGKLFDPYVITIIPAARETDLARTLSPPPPAPRVQQTSPSPAAATAPAVAGAGAGERRGMNRWIWVGIGVVAVAALASSGGGGGGGGGGGDADDGTGTVTITAPVP